MNTINRIIDFTRNNRIKSGKSVLIFSFIQRFAMSVCINIIGPLIPLIAGDLDVGLDYIGSAIAIGTFALLIASISTGFFLESFGFKKVIFGGGLLIGLGCLGLLFSYSYIMFIISYSVLQTGSGIITVSTLSLVGNHYFENKSKSILISNIGLTSGAVVAPLLASLVAYMNSTWQNLFVYLIILQFFLIIFLSFLKTSLKDTSVVSFKSFINTSKIIASHPYIILCCFISFLYVSTMQTFYTWFTSYFSTLNIRLDASSLILAIYSIAILAGMFVKNYTVKYVEEKKLLLISISLSFAFLLSAFLITNLVGKIILIFLFGISVAGNFSLTFSMGLNIGSKFTNIVSGLLHGSSYIGVVIFQYLSGYFSENLTENSVLYIDLILLFVLIIVVAVINKKGLRYLSRDINII
jgi:MFS family permease